MTIGTDKKRNGREGLGLIAGQAEDGMTARGVLRRTQGVSQRLIRKIKFGGSGALYINGQPARFHDKVKAGDVIQLIFPEEESWIEPQDIPLSILYEDDDMLAIDKQPGMIVHPTKGHKDGTLANAIVFHMRSRNESYRPRFISRLDMGTSGVLLIGKNSHAQDSLAKQSEAGRVEKIYTAVLIGRLEDNLPSSGLIDLPIGQPVPGDPHRAVLPVEKGGYPSKTAYSIICADNAEPCGMELILTIVRARLLTGRTHQIRVHFAHYGHPVLGDQLYGGASPLISRQALHASEIIFTHPATGCPVRIEAPLPADIASLLQTLGKH